MTNRNFDDLPSGAIFRRVWSASFEEVGSRFPNTFFQEIGEDGVYNPSKKIVTR
jgi:hypothetical protein